MEKLTTWQSTRDVNFVGSYDLIVDVDQNNQPVYKDRVVTIDYVNAKEKVMDSQTSKYVEKTVAHFKEQDLKPMILNTTNKKGIENATGIIFLERWSGCKVLLTVEHIKAFGKVQPALRIKPIPKKLCDVCGKAIEYKTWEMSMEKYGKSLCSKECLEKIQNKGE